MSVLREAARTAAPSLARHARCMTSLTTFTPPTLPDLPYDYNALEPVISAEIMTLHHKKHHQASPRGAMRYSPRAFSLAHLVYLHASPGAHGEARDAPPADPLLRTLA